jgi:hypothetical protein
MKPITNFISQPHKIGPVIFIATGIYKTCKDYKDAYNKKAVLAKDAAILAGSAAAFAVIFPVTRRLCNAQFIESVAKLFKKNVVKNPAVDSLKKTEYVVKECVGGVLNTLAGVLGAIYSNALMQKYVLNKPFFVKEKPENPSPAVPQSRVFQRFDYINKTPVGYTVNRMFTTMSDMPDLKLLEKPMIALTGFSVANTDGYHNKFKKTTHELLSNTLIPTFFVSVASLFTNNSKSYVKYPVLLASLLTGAVAGAKVSEKYKDKIDKKIDGMNMKYIALK